MSDVFKEPPRCQDWVRNRDLERVRCTARAHWVALDPDGSPHHLVCKPHGVLYTGIDLRPIEYVTAEFLALTAEWSPRRRGQMQLRPYTPMPPPVRRCPVCEIEIATAVYWSCEGCKYWVLRQSPLGKRALHAVARRGRGLSVAYLRAHPEQLREIPDLGPKTAQWLLEAELPVREAVNS